MPTIAVSRLFSPVYVDHAEIRHGSVHGFADACQFRGGCNWSFYRFFQRLDNAYRLYLFTLFITTKLYVVRRTPRYFAT